MSVSDLNKKAGNPFSNILGELESECPAEELTEDDFGKSWRNRSLCSGVNNPDLFFLKGQEGPSKVTCSVCPTKVECAIWALMYDEEGIWGGTNEKDRKEFKESHPVYIQALLDKAKAFGKYFPRLLAKDNKKTTRAKEDRYSLVGCSDILVPGLEYISSIHPKTKFDFPEYSDRLA
jgi:WhiB family transcriptional regulator, redox-sensing transcriptional regulator